MLIRSLGANIFQRILRLQFTGLGQFTKEVNIWNTWDLTVLFLNQSAFKDIDLVFGKTRTFV